ncbi:Pattern recognition serine proteinase [Operophtera brumata]|uniref:Pattern recognition serine proteinase n=1 Tax=Operophtera brumata TaxID=104452 RepID=A0A0L7LUQ3_OPEBR|nr:Pattern recognition serine proteinase [Operophtera brumata]
MAALRLRGRLRRDCTCVRQQALLRAPVPVRLRRVRRQRSHLQWGMSSLNGSDETVHACANKPCSEHLFRTRGKCVLPPFQEHGTYVSNIPGAAPGLGFERVILSNISCQRGYALLGVTSFDEVLYN